MKIRHFHKDNKLVATAAITSDADGAVKAALAVVGPYENPKAVCKKRGVQIATGRLAAGRFLTFDGEDIPNKIVDVRSGNDMFRTTLREAIHFEVAEEMARNGSLGRLIRLSEV